MIRPRLQPGKTVATLFVDDGAVYAGRLHARLEPRVTQPRQRCIRRDETDPRSLGGTTIDLENLARDRGDAFDAHVVSVDARRIQRSDATVTGAVAKRDRRETHVARR